MSIKQKSWKETTTKEKITGVAVMVLVVLFASKVITGFGKQKQEPQVGTQQTQTEGVRKQSPIEQETGKYLDYSYTILRKEGEPISVISFQPFLARDDTILIGAMREIIKQIYGENRLKKMTPTVVNKDGTNLLMFEGIEKNYYFLIVKEDTGEVHSFSLWDK